MRKDIFKKAHKLTKEIIRKGDNYRATFRLCLSFVYSQFKKGVVKMVELKGTEKQVKWAEELRSKRINHINDLLENILEPKTDTAKLRRSYVRKVLKINKNQVGGTKEAVTKAIETRLNNLKEQLYNISDSNFFIDNRFKQFDELVERMDIF